MAAWQTVSTLAILVLSVGLSSSASADMKSLTAANTWLGRAILNEIGASYDNVVFSPYSLHSALTMAAMGARGDTLAEMKSTLGISDLTTSAINQAYMELISSLNDTGDVDVLTGNAIFQNPNFAISQSYKELVQTKYYAIAKELNFTEGAEKMINDYVEMKTNDMIKDLIAPRSLNSDTTKLVLVNTIFFSATWHKEFKKSDTKKADFHVNSNEKVQVDMMSNTGTYQMKFEDEYTTLRLPFTHDRFALYIVVPNKTDALLNPRCLPVTSPSEYFTGLNETIIEIFVPKFEINFKKSLNEILQTLGIKKAFTPQADFSFISPDSMISEVLHQAVIEITETGTTAAAATAVQIVLTSVNIANSQFRVNRPFLFFLRDDTNEEILFQGKFSRPMANPSAFAEEVQRTVPKCEGKNGGGNGGGGNGGGGNGVATLHLALFGWIICISYSLFHLHRIIN